ncbi:hypothetical protein [Rhodococcus sp. BE178]|uniref:hypothetical protein n=1 Tax=Rhodococcus sp. BE178 TaxID=2817737 RepID=UPI003D1DEDCF
MITALTPVLLAIIGAVTAWQGKQIRDLRDKFADLSSKFRLSIWYIRDVHRWDRDGRSGALPAIPDDLRDEV